MQASCRRALLRSRHVRSPTQSVRRGSGVVSQEPPLWRRVWAFPRRNLIRSRPGFARLDFKNVRAYHSAVPSSQSTIYALSTAPGKAAIAVIRISGPACLTIYSALCPDRLIPKARYVTLRKLYEPHKTPSESTILDAGALVLYFPAPQTVTGEDVLELHVHGGSATVRAVLGAIPECVQHKSHKSTSHRVLYAEAGEFTRRAFLNDRLDLTQIEALGDTLSATTEQQRRLSIRGTSSTLSRRYESWRQQLLYARGELEALIDFSEDQHFDDSPATLASSVAVQVEQLIRQIKAHRENAVRGELLRHGISISLLGAPNAGKSSLLNRVVGREAAIVSKEEGTTRDIVEVGVDLGGWFCRLGDMAGLRAAPEPIAKDSDGPLHVGAVEREGIKRAIDRALSSDVLIIVLSIERASKPGTDSTGRSDLRLDPSVLATTNKYASSKQKGTIIVAVNKTDNLPCAPGAEADVNGKTLPAPYIEALTSAIPTLDPSHIFGISCNEATLTHRSQSPPSTKESPSSDPGNIQTFLRGLVQAFEEMTAAVVPTQEESPTQTLVSGDTRATHPNPSTETDRSIYESSLGASERQRILLDECATHLTAFLSGLRDSSNAAAGASAPKSKTENDNPGASDDDPAEIDIVVLAEELRAAAACLARMTGRGEEAGDVDEVLGVVFEKFCVGK